MTRPVRRVLSSAALLLLTACDAPTVEAATNLTENGAVSYNEVTIPHAEPDGDRERERISGSADKEPRMLEPDPVAPPTPPKPPAAPPRRVILPSPIQPPAEIDPVRPDSGDEVPR